MSPNNTIILQIQHAVQLSNKPIFILVKAKKGFVTNLDGLDLSGCISILLCSDKARKKIEDRQIKLFDFVVCYDIDQNHVIQWRDLSICRYAGVEKILEKLFEQNNFTVNRRVSLLVCEEPLMRFAAELRTKFKFRIGLNDKEVVRFTDKLAMKKRAMEFDIDTAKFYRLPKSVNKSLTSIEQICEYLHFPLFVKPRNGCASVGTAKLLDAKALVEWTSNHLNDPFEFIVEEWIDGEEYSIYMLLDEKSRIKLCKIFKNLSPIAEFIGRCGRPLAKIELINKKLTRSDSLSSSSSYATSSAGYRNRSYRLESYSEENLYNSILEFAQRVVEAWKPIPAGIFFVEFFKEANSGKFLLTEVCARMPSGCFPSLLLSTSGINYEALHFMASFNPDNFLPPDFQTSNNSPTKMAYLRYPRREGKVRKLNHIPFSLKSDYKAEWKVEVGTEMQNPRGLAKRHETLTIAMWNENYEQLCQDFELLYRFDPIETE